MKALGILINLIHDSEDAEMVISNHGNSLLSAMVTLLQEDPSNEIREQVLCVFVNLSSSSKRGRDLLVGCDELMRCTSYVLVRMHVHTPSHVTLSHPPPSPYTPSHISHALTLSTHIASHPSHDHPPPPPPPPQPTKINTTI